MFILEENMETCIGDVLNTHVISFGLSNKQSWRRKKKRRNMGHEAHNMLE